MRKIDLLAKATWASFCIVSFLYACGPKKDFLSNTQEAWNPVNDPLHLGQDYQRRLDRLPQEGALKWAPWPDTYWPSNRGGVSSRWRTGEDGFYYVSPDQNALRAMSLRERSLLSPAEKFDAFRGDFNYSLVASERRRTNPFARSWEGLCHGWAVASLQFQEPGSILLKSVDGIEIPFGSSDIKALLALLQGVYGRTRIDSLGGRCNAELSSNPYAAMSSECRDVNAGSFHIVTANQLGLKKQGFVFDIARGQEVWNHPAYAYKSNVIRYQNPSPGAHPSTVKEAIVKTELKYSVETSPSWDLIFPESIRYLGTKVYDYRLELDAQNQIIGGEWLSNDRPDFLWKMERAPLTGNWEVLKKIYDPSIASGRAIRDPLL